MSSAIKNYLQILFHSTKIYPIISFCYFFKLYQPMLSFVQIVTFIGRRLHCSWLHQSELLILLTCKFPLHNVALLSLSFCRYLQNLVTECSNENHIRTCNVLLLDPEHLPLVPFFLCRSVNVCPVFLRFDCQIMALTLVFYVKVVSLSNKRKCLGFTMIGSSKTSDFLIFLVFFQVNDLVVHLVFDSVVLFDKFAMAFDDFFTKIVVHFVDYW
jgi:hypothetical protein